MTFNAHPTSHLISNIKKISIFYHCWEWKLRENSIPNFMETITFLEITICNGKSYNTNYELLNAHIF
jgi:hypothetical protein